MIDRRYRVVCNGCRHARPSLWATPTEAWNEAEAHGWSRQRNGRTPTAHVHLCKWCTAKANGKPVAPTSGSSWEQSGSEGQ